MTSRVASASWRFIVADRAPRLRNAHPCHFYAERFANLAGLAHRTLTATRTRRRTSRIASMSARRTVFVATCFGGQIELQEAHRSI